MNYSDENNNGLIDSNERLEESHYYPPDNIRDGLEHTYYDPGKKEYKRVQEGGGDDWQIKLVEVPNSGYQYKYNGKELQDELDLNWYDLGARNYDPAIGRMPTIDPRAEEYNYQSPYAFAANNPVFFIDINGEGVDTDYKLVKKTGKVERVDENDGSENNKHDRLYATDDNGNVTENHVQINKDKASDNTVISDLSKSEYVGKNADGSKNRSIATTDASGQDNIFQVFLFAANNSDVEWSAVRGVKDGKELFGVGTYQNGIQSPGFDDYGLSIQETISEMHSHTHTTTMRDELGSLYGDRGHYQGLDRKNGGKKPFNYYVYMKNSGRLFSLGSYYSKGEYIRNIKGNHKRLYFGTLNSK